MLNERGALSEREMEILRLVATGATNQEIAVKLTISVNTVKVHLRNIFDKLGVTSRTEATMVAVREGWVQVPGQAGLPEAVKGEAENDAAAAPSSALAQSVLPIIDRPPYVSIGKRIGLAIALALTLGLFLLPPVLASRANGEHLDPIQGIFPVRSQGQPAARWQVRAQMPTPRTHLAVVSYNNLIYAIGGVGVDGVVGKVEVYDPKTDSWTTRGLKPTPVAFVSAVVLGNKIYVPGGAIAESQVTDVLEVYDPEKNTWEHRAPLPKALASYALAVLDNTLYLFGGWDGQAYVASVYRYDPTADRWEELSPMAHPLGLAGAAPLKDRIYLVGGYDDSVEYNTCNAYQPSTGTWTACAPMAMRRSGLALITVRDGLYAIGGGAVNGYLTFNERYDPRVNAWTRVETPVVDQWLGLGAAFCFPYIYAIGGWNGATLSINEAYQAVYQVQIPVNP